MSVDFHSHILPKFDDGAEDENMAVKMIEMSKGHGVNEIVSTSHCYPRNSEDIERFLIKREKSYNLLVNTAKRENIELPKIYLGSEVHLTCDITKFNNISKLCIADTCYMLVEMPYSKWTESMVDVVYRLSLMGIKPIIAHAERNKEQNSELLSSLYNLDVLIQINAESFADRKYKAFIDKMMKMKMVHLIGSDMHNLTVRKPNMNIAYKRVKKRYGEECWSYIMENSQTVLRGDELSYDYFKSFKKKTVF